MAYGEKLAAAISYAARGFEVIPLYAAHKGACRCGDKNCEVPAKHSYVDYSLTGGRTDHEGIRRLWKSWPDANVGVVTGNLSGLLVIDVDSERALTKFRKPFPFLFTGDVPTVCTSRGYHFWFKHPGHYIPTQNGNWCDILACSGHVVAPPSQHASGKPYVWQKPLKRTLPDIPPDLLRFILPQKVKRRL